MENNNALLKKIEKILNFYVLVMNEDIVLKIVRVLLYLIFTLHLCMNFHKKIFNLLVTNWLASE